MAATTLYPKETAKVLRTVLKKAFPNTKFSITTGRGAGVSSVDLSWTDGPTVKEVDAITGPFEMGRFNGMTDSYDYDKKEDRQLLVDGVHYEAGCRYVMTHRTCSAELARKAVALLVEYWGGVEYVPELIEQKSGGWWFANSSDANRPLREDLANGPHYDWQSQIHQALSDPSRFVREAVEVAEVVEAVPVVAAIEMAVETGQEDDSDDPTSVEYDYRNHPPFVATAPITAPAGRTWTDHTFRCRSCKRLAFASKEAIEFARKEALQEGTDAEIANTFDFCLECVDGEKIKGEHLEMTPAHIEALRTCIEIADPGDDDDEGRWPDGPAAIVQRAYEALRILEGQSNV